MKFLLFAGRVIQKMLNWLKASLPSSGTSTPSCQHFVIARRRSVMRRELSLIDTGDPRLIAINFGRKCVWHYVERNPSCITDAYLALISHPRLYECYWLWHIRIKNQQDASQKKPLLSRPSILTCTVLHSIFPLRILLLKISNSLTTPTSNSFRHWNHTCTVVPPITRSPDSVASDSEHLQKSP